MTSVLARDRQALWQWECRLGEMAQNRTSREEVPNIRKCICINRLTLFPFQRTTCTHFLKQLCAPFRWQFPFLFLLFFSGCSSIKLKNFVVLSWSLGQRVIRERDFRMHSHSHLPNRLTGAKRGCVNWKNWKSAIIIRGKNGTNGDYKKGTKIRKERKCWSRVMCSCFNLLRHYLTSNALYLITKIAYF